MDWQLDKSKPISQQIFEQVCMGIVFGEFLPGEKLPSVRETAVTAGVNPNTVQHAYESLSQSGIVYSQPGSGWYVTEDTENAKSTLDKLRIEKTGEYFAAMSKLGFSAEETKKLVEEWNT